MSVELKNLETVIGALYQSPRKPLEKDYLDTLIEFSKGKRFVFVCDLNATNADWNSRLATSRAGK